MQNAKKWIQLSYVFLTFITWLFFYYVTDMVWGIAKLPLLPPDWVITPAQAVAFLFAIVLFAILQKDSRINQFAGEVASELSKVTWPDKKETVLSTGVIIVMVAIATVIMFGYDSLLGTLANLMYK